MLNFIQKQTTVMLSWILFSSKTRICTYKKWYSLTILPVTDYGTVTVAGTCNTMTIRFIVTRCWVTPPYRTHNHREITTIRESTISRLFPRQQFTPHGSANWRQTSDNYRRERSSAAVTAPLQYPSTKCLISLIHFNLLKVAIWGRRYETQANFATEIICKASNE